MTAGPNAFTGRPMALLASVLLATTLAACSDDPTAPPGATTLRHSFSSSGTTLLVNNLEEPGDGACTVEHCTFREAVGAAQAGDAIAFDPVLEGTIVLTAFVEISIPMSIDGDNRITLERSESQPGGILWLIEGADAVITGLAFRNGSPALRLDENTSLAISRCTISEGGIGIRTQGTMLVNECTISDNAGNDGGGIEALFGHVTTITNSTISRNTGGLGGGVFNSNGTLTIYRSTISGNVTGAPVGAAIHKMGGSTYIRSSTITGNIGNNNRVENSGSSAGVSSAIVFNSIVAGNLTWSDYDYPNWLLVETPCGFTSEGYNLTTQVCDGSQPTDVVVPANLVFTDVISPDLADNGGPTATHAVLARGFAMDAGRCLTETTDQRGASRPYDDAVVPNAFDGCDIGAFEWQPGEAPPAASADVMVSLAVDRTSVKQGELLKYYVRVANNGPSAALNVVVNNTLSSGVTFVSIAANKGTTVAPPVGNTGTVTWNVGTLLDQDAEVAELVVTVLVKGKTTITHTSTATSSVGDPNEANNAASITVSVDAGNGGGASGGGGGKGKNK